MRRLTEPDERFARAFDEGRVDPQHPLFGSWTRAAARGLARHGDAHPLGTSDLDLADRRLRLAEIFREERALLSPLASKLSAGSLSAIIADPDGIILSAQEGSAFATAATRTRLLPGADWSEHARGTNAIGTAIVERAPVAVIGRAHYETRNAGLFCYATPVHDARGDLCAVIDVSGPLERHDDSIGVAVQLAGAALQRALSAIAFARIGLGNLGALERLLARAASPTLLVEARGPIRLRNAAASSEILRGRADVDCQTLFGIAFAELAAMAQRGGELGFEAHEKRWSVALDPLLDGDARALGVIVHFEPRRRAPSSEPPQRSVPRSPRPPSAKPSPQHPAFDAIVSEDVAVAAAKRMAARFAATAMPVLLLAETGTGKELFAKAIHGASAVARGAFVAVNCGAIAPALLESELFGYAPGAFTGAARQGSSGLLGAADGGTLFLDEIAEMPESLQAALLRVLDDGLYHRIGDPKPQRSTFRLIGATCRDLPAMVERGAFRRDLFFRIHGALVRIPPLRDRSDRLALARHLLAAASATPLELGASAIDHIAAHAWPGNVRELKTAMLHATAMCTDGLVEREHLPEALLGGPKASVPIKPRGAVLREAAEEALRATSGTVSEAARRLGVARDTLYRMMRAR
jgi:transcriptional regulator of acetoin/glycerol metabolism